MSEKSDASTTTEDMKIAPLCLFYFSHPFGILSPHPPSVTMAPQDCIPKWLPSAFNDSSLKKFNVIPRPESSDQTPVPKLNLKTKLKKYERKNAETIAEEVEHTKHTKNKKKCDRLASFDVRRSKWTDRCSIKAMPWPSGSTNVRSGFHRKNHNFIHTLPPLERSEIKTVDEAQEWSSLVHKFKSKTLLPPIEFDKSSSNSEADHTSVRIDLRFNREHKRSKKLKKSPTMRLIYLKSTRGINKGRSKPNRSAARKLMSCLLQGANRATTATLPALGEVLKIVRQAWDSPKTLPPSTIRKPSSEIKKSAKLKMGMEPPLLPGASPGLLRRRYSLPETVMRKYKLAQLKSESDESEIGSAPSPRIPSPARGGRGRDRGPRSVLLRRLWGRDPPPVLGGSHSELRYWDSRSGSSSPDRTCEACKRLEKNIVIKADIHSPPVYKTYPSQALSPKRQIYKSGSSSQSPERTLSTTENSSVRTDVYLRENRQCTSPSTVMTVGSMTSDRSSFKSVCMSDSSSKLGLSSLVTSSYPVTDTISTSEMTRSSASYSSDDTSRSRYNHRPKTASDSVKSSPTHKKRRQSLCVYMDSVESPMMASSITSSDTTNQSSTTTTTTTTTTETSTTDSTTTKKETTSPTDSAMSNAETFKDLTDTTETTDSDTVSSNNDHKYYKNHVQHRKTTELSDTGISDGFDCDSKNMSSQNEDEFREESTYSDYSTGMVTCIEKSSEVKQTIECLEVVVSETINSPPAKKDASAISDTEIELSPKYGKIDIDQYVSNILIDSLNSMTDQINEMNSNIDDDSKLNILEKEIKVKLQSAGSNPVNIISNPIITTLITSIPDKELLETTVIEEKMRSLAYTTESKLFPMETTIEIVGQQVNNDEINDESKLDELLDDSNENVDDQGFYIDSTDTPLPYDVNDNQDPKRKAVLRQLHKMFENNQNQDSNIDSNFNLCYEGSHLEMSTDVDVFVDNSLNKMMNSIDINYNNADLCNSIENISFDNIQNSLNGNLEALNGGNQTEAKTKQTDVLSNIGAGSLYQNPPKKPLVVPRYSAIPHSESMEVNTSTEDDEASCQSDCMSLVDSLDDPNSPRPPSKERKSRSLSKYDTKPVRGDIMSLLPENSVLESKSPREKSETFFVPIKENLMETIKENIVVAEHMPEKLKERLFKRQQKRELRKEYYRRKKMKQLMKDLEKKKIENEKAKADEAEGKECKEEVKEVKKEKDSPVKENKKVVIKKPSRGEKSKEDPLRNIESFIIDKKGNYQAKKPKIAEKKSHNTLKPINGNKIDVQIEETQMYAKSDSSDSIYPVEKVKIFKTKQEAEYQSNPRRLYQKTEFQEGDKHIEILEIVECVESSPEPPSDESQSSPPVGRRSSSKIPVLQKVTKKNLPKSGKGSRSTNKNVPSNITSAKNDRDSKTPNSKTDELIANILIDAIKQDNSSDVHLVLSPRDKKKNTKPLLKRSNQKSVPNKYSGKFDVIPEEKSSISVESSNEDLSSKSTKKKDTKSLKTIDEVIKSDRKCDIQDSSTSPIPQYISTGTSPIPDLKKQEDLVNMKGKQALGTREGWAGFCRPQTRYSPDTEGLHPSSNNPSDREAIGKTKCKQEDAAPASQNKLRASDSKFRKEKEKFKKGKHELIKEKSSKPTSEEEAKNRKNSSELRHFEQKLQKNENTTLILPPYMNQSFTQSSDMSTSSGSDSDTSGCPAIVPRWPPIAPPRHRRVSRRQRPEDFKMPFQNLSGSWSVTLAGSCYTTLPSDVEMKVCFPKTCQANSQSDSGLGEEHHKHSSTPTCKKCGDKKICKNCKTVQSCRCSAVAKNRNKDTTESDQNFLPTTQMKKSAYQPREGLMMQETKYNYLPDVNDSRMKKKPGVKMTRRFSLHCWLPEDKHRVKENSSNIDVSETTSPIGEELSVFGCAIMPETKPRVPTMSERDLTRVHAAQYYSRHRYI